MTSTVRAEALGYRWAALLLGAALLASGCVTLAPRPGAGALSTIEPDAQALPHRCGSVRGLGSDIVMTRTGKTTPSTRDGIATQDSRTCGGRAVPPGWPDVSSGTGAALLAPFLTCTSPAEFRGLEFERTMVKMLRADAQLPRAERRFLGDFDKPRIETYVGVKKPGTGLRFADVLVIEEGELAVDTAKAAVPGVEVLFQ